LFLCREALAVGPGRRGGPLAPEARPSTTTSDVARFSGRRHAMTARESGAPHRFGQAKQVLRAFCGANGPEVSATRPRRTHFKVQRQLGLRFAKTSQTLPGRLVRKRVRADVLSSVLKRVRRNVGMGRTRRLGAVRVRPFSSRPGSAVPHGAEGSICFADLRGQRGLKKGVYGLCQLTIERAPFLVSSPIKSHKFELNVRGRNSWVFARRRSSLYFYW